MLRRLAGARVLRARARSRHGRTAGAGPAARRAASASQDPARNTESLLRAHDRFARELELDGAIEGFVPNLTNDVAYLHPDQEIITGREAARAFLKTIYPQPHTMRTVLHRVAGQASADGSLGYTFGWLEEITAPKNAPAVTKYGRFIAMWKKGDDGWRVQAFLRLTSSAPPSYSKYLTVWVRTDAGWRFLMDGGNARPAP